MVKRVGHDVRRHARFQRPTDDFTVEQVEHDGQVQPAFIRPQVRDVRCPNLVRRRRREVSGEQVLRHRQAMLRVRRNQSMHTATGPECVKTNSALQDQCYKH